MYVHELSQNPTLYLAENHCRSPFGCPSQHSRQGKLSRSERAYHPHAGTYVPSPRAHRHRHATCHSASLKAMILSSPSKEASRNVSLPSTRHLRNLDSFCPVPPHCHCCQRCLPFRFVSTLIRHNRLLRATAVRHRRETLNPTVNPDPAQMSCCAR